MFQSSSSASVYFQATGDDFYSALAMNGCLLLEDLRCSRCTGGSLSILKRRSRLPRSAVACEYGRIFGITQISLCTSYTTRRPFIINYSIGKQVRKLRLYHIIATFQVFCSPLCPTTCLTLVSFVHTIGLGSHSTQPQPPFDFVRMHFFHNKI